jgi:hypothetical protein
MPELDDVFTEVADEAAVDAAEPEDGLERRLPDLHGAVVQ